ncbi:MAG: glycosyltransferase, partial [Candidatus Andersenbacteria bacterium]|nr:glycosyltransferase [Candidatus Andersenbacteria bacterium]
MWLGKFNPDKGVHEAILAARQVGLPLILGGKIDSLEKEDLAYYQEKVEPYIDGKSVIYVGELNDVQKNAYLGGAVAFLNPIQWNEPFGLTMVEAMACGTPVIAFAQGAAPEIVVDKTAGFLVKDVAEMADAIGKANTIDRAACRRHVESMFSAEKMADNYEQAYKAMLAL